MPQSPEKTVYPDATARCFGLRIENHMLQVAIATRLIDGRFRVDIDDIQCAEPSGWLSPFAAHLLVDALATLVERHEMRRQRVAVSLDGDFCVTRVLIGPTEQVDAELEMQGDRIPRYLQLGPGEKVTGSSRKKIDSAVDYAVTGVVNRSLIQLVYDALREVDIDVQWVEPSLVSVARMVGQHEVGGDQPVMIADCTGTQWDVGIACSGRLLLDYRPASANSDEAFRDALDGHITRLKRFCHRHLGVTGGELNRLMICGTGEKPKRAVETLGDSLGITPEILRVPNLTDLYDIDPANLQSDSVPAVATVLPLMIDVSDSDVPDLLNEVRRAPELPLSNRLVRLCWPVAASMLILGMSYGLVTKERQSRAGTVESRAGIKTQIDATEVKFAELTQRCQLRKYLTQIERQTVETDWDRLLGQVTQSLPDSCRLNEYRVESGGQVVIDGTVLEESILYEVIESFRGIPNISQVALKGTTPEASVRGTRFVVRLITSADSGQPDSGAQGE